MYFNTNLVSTLKSAIPLGVRDSWAPCTHHPWQKLPYTVTRFCLLPHDPGPGGLPQALEIPPEERFEALDEPPTDPRFVLEASNLSRSRRGLLKGEQLHALARCVHYGRLDQRDFERQTGAASCLLLILAAALVHESA